MILDIHTHLGAARCFPEPFYAGWRANIERLLPAGLRPEHRRKVAARFRLDRDDPFADLHVEEMNAAGVDASVLLLIDFGVAWPEGFPTIEEVYAMTRAAAAKHPGRLLPFAGIDPRRGRHGLDLVDRALREWGFRGLKLYPPCGFSPSDRSLDPFYDLCAHHGLPVLTHTGPTTPALPFRHTRPEDVDDAARRFPGVNFILAHGACVHHEEAALLAEFRPNVYVDTAGFQLSARRGEWAGVLALYKRRGILRKLLFGTDWPLHRQHGSLGDCLRVLRPPEARLSDAEASCVLFENARELLRIQ